MSETAAYRRFIDSMTLNHERWHDGIGYDLGALAEMSPAERQSIETRLIANTTNWRDVEALAALATDAAQAHIRKCLTRGPSDVRLAAARALADDKASERSREDAIIHALETAAPMSGIAGALDAAAGHKSPRVIDALFRCALSADRELAVNAAGLLYYLFSKASEPFDWAKRPFFLRFGEGPAEQRKVFAEMCAELGVDARKYLD